MAPFVKSLPTCVKDTNHALTFLKQFSFPGSNNLLFTTDLTCTMYTVIPNDDWKASCTKVLFRSILSKNLQPLHCFILPNMFSHLMLFIFRRTYYVVVWVIRVCSVVLRRTVVGVDWHFANLSGRHHHSDDGFRSSCRNVSQHQQQSFSGLHYKPGRSLKPQH